MNVSTEPPDVKVQSPAESVGQLTFTHTASRFKSQFRYARLRMGLTLAAVDGLILLASCATSLYIWSFVREDLFISFYLNLIPLVFAFLTVYFITGLYTAVGVNPVEELRQQTISTAICFVGLGALSFWLRNAESYSRAAFIMASILSFILLPTGREVVRAVFSRFGWWGEPVALIGYGSQGEEILNFLSNNPQLGFNPVVVINGFSQNKGAHTTTPDVPVIEAQGLLNEKYARFLKDIRTAILIEPEIPEDFFQAIVQEYGFRFDNLIWVSNSKRFGSLWVIPVDIGGVLGLRVRQNLMSDYQKTLKRLLDIAVVLLTLPVTLPLVALITLAIWVDSPGKPFFAHRRIGQNGQHIKVWKFRSMVKNADQYLEECFKKDPALKLEWETTQKMKDDPRITRMGRFLRKSSLDELPQVWNVIKGEMSLVGPRPIIDEEIKHYANRFKVYIQVKPGITGLWQISGRNNLDYPTRVRLDEYYVRNWSFWFDIYILTHTAGAIISGKGAY